MAHSHDHGHNHGHTHGHGHGHHHHHHHHDHGTQGNHRAFLIAVILNLGFTIAEAVYAIMANSMSLLADAGHNLGDVLGLVFSWVASWLLLKPATQRYSYGYKKTSILAALANALLLVLASGIIAYESILRLFHPLPVVEKIIIIVAALGIVINGGTALLFIRGQDDLNIKSAFLHLAGDALISLGVVVTGVIVLFTHWLWLDPLIGLLIVITILAGSWGLVRDSVNSVLDAVPRHINQQAVQDYLMNLPGVTQVHDLHIWGLSTREVALTVHLVMPQQTLTDDDRQKINHYLKQQFQIHHATLQVEQGSAENPCIQAESC